MAYNNAPAGWWQEFVGGEPARTAKLAVVSKDGSPHVAPVWVDLDGDDPVSYTHLRAHETSRAISFGVFCL